MGRATLESSTATCVCVIEALAVNGARQLVLQATTVPYAAGMGVAPHLPDDVVAIDSMAVCYRVSRWIVKVTL